MFARAAAIVCVSSLFASFLPAQLVGPGLTWNGSSGNNAGSFVPSCDDLPVNAVVGETVDLQIWGDAHAPFVLLASGSASQCLPFPGLGNALVLDPPLVSIAFGTLTKLSPCLSCPSAFQLLRFAIPSAPPGLSASLQAVSFGGGNPAFTVAITFTIG